MSWGHITDVFNWLMNGGITALVVLFLRYHRQIFDLIDTVVNHTATKTDNEIASKLKSTAATLVAVFESQPIPGTEKKQEASTRLMELADQFGKPLSQDEANDLIEEAFQTNIKPIQPTEIRVGQTIKLDGQTFKLGKKADGGYTLTAEKGD